MLLFGFVPFSVFWNDASQNFLDRSKITVAIAEDCSTVTEKSPDVFEVEVASKASSREYGLSNRRTKLNSKNGMLFVFTPPQKVNFWMKETYIPLQIAYFNTNDELFELTDMPVEKDPKNPTKTYASSDVTFTALEIQPKRLKMTKKMRKLCTKEFVQPKAANSSQVVR